VSGEAGAPDGGHRRTVAPGPYGTNEGDIWTGEHSDVGEMLMEQDGLLLIHEVLFKDGSVGECLYCVDPKSPDMGIQDLVKRARAGLSLYMEAKAREN
jgi:hypothetical protein